MAINPYQQPEIRSVIRSVHQIELSSRCNLRCKYCPHPKLQREKTDMDWKTFEAAIVWTKSLGGEELSFTGMGEAVMHPEFPAMLRYARRELPGKKFLLSSNGVDVSAGALRAIKDTDTDLYLSPHRPEVLGDLLKRCGELKIVPYINQSLVAAGFDWAGQVDWPNLAPVEGCQYLMNGAAVVLQNGDIVNCCFDAHGLYPVGNVLDDILPKYFTPMAICEGCHFVIPEEEVRRHANS